MRVPLDQTFGDYRLVRLISSGGFADVYEAEHLHLPGIKAAVKLLKGSFTPQQIETLRKEALMVSTLEHPHIVQVRTFSLKDDMPYLVMSYAEGGALHQRQPRGERLPLAEILTYVSQIAQALQYAHQRRIVHRDLKPANLLLTQDGRVQVADFGIAVVMHSSTSRTVQEIAGTWAYMAPEQFHRQAEPASDQYSLAIMVYQWLCGEPPFTGIDNLYALPYQHLYEPPPSLCQRESELSPGIEQVVMKALAKQPGERFAGIQAFAQAFDNACTTPLSATAPLIYKDRAGGAIASAWSPNSMYVASGDDDATVRIWDATTGQTLHILRGHAADVSAVAWSGDGRFIALGSEDRTVRVWEAASGTPVCSYEATSLKGMP